MKIIFRAPKLIEMHSGNWCIELTEEGNWEYFPRFAEAFSKQIGFAIINRADAVDMRIFEIEYLGQRIRLVYEDFPNGISLESMNASGAAILKYLFKQLSSEASENGV